MPLGLWAGGHSLNDGFFFYSSQSIDSHCLSLITFLSTHFHFFPANILTGASYLARSCGYKICHFPKTLDNTTIIIQCDKHLCDEISQGSEDLQMQLGDWWRLPKAMVWPLV